MKMNFDKMHQIKKHHPAYSGIEILIETGTLEAKNALQLSPLFMTVYSVELSTALWRRAAELYRGRNITFLLGDSAVVIPLLSEAYQECPVVWYLDAHWFAWGAQRLPVAIGNPFPLWTELEVLSKRNQPDIVLVDDVHAFGREGDWSNVSKESLDAALGPRRMDSRLWEDHYVAWMNGTA